MALAGWRIDRDLGAGAPIDQARGIQERGRLIDRLFGVEHDRHGLSRTPGIDALLGRFSDRRGLIEPRPICLMKSLIAPSAVSGVMYRPLLTSPQTLSSATKSSGMWATAATFPRLRTAGLRTAVSSCEIT